MRSLKVELKRVLAAEKPDQRALVLDDQSWDEFSASFASWGSCPSALLCSCADLVSTLSVGWQGAIAHSDVLSSNNGRRYPGKVGRVVVWMIAWQ